MSRTRGGVNLSKPELILIIAVAVLCTMIGYFLANATNPELVNTILDEVVVSMISSLVTGIVLAVFLKYMTDK